MGYRIEINGGCAVIIHCEMSTAPTLKVFNANGDCIAVLGTIDEYMDLISRAGKI